MQHDARMCCRYAQNILHHLPQRLSRSNSDKEKEAELTVSSVVVAKIIGSIHCAYPAFTEGWPGRVDLGGWLNTKEVCLFADGHPSQNQLGSMYSNFVDVINDITTTGCGEIK